MILITGATGFVGRAVVRRLTSEQNEVSCLLRPSRREQQLATGVPFCIVSAGMSDLPALRTAMQDVTAIVHMTGEEDLDREGTLRSHVEDTANLNGLLDVSLLGTFVPNPSDTFTILTADEVNGHFANAQTSVTFGQGIFDVHYSSTAVTLSNYRVPEPSTVVMILVTLAAALLLRRRRKL